MSGAPRNDRWLFDDPPDDFDEIDEGEDFDAGDECGRWDQNAPGGMSEQCRLAGTEFCDWDCPYSR